MKLNWNFQGVCVRVCVGKGVGKGGGGGEVGGGSNQITLRVILHGGV